MLRWWHDLLDTWAVDSTSARQAFDDVVEHLAGSGRFYHTLDHVQDVLAAVE